MARDQPNILTLPSLPNLVGRVAVLGGTDADKTALNIALALRHTRAQGSVVCLDAHHHKQTEIQFRLLLRDNVQYIPLPASGGMSAQISQTILKLVHREEPASAPPLLVLDSVRAGETLEPLLSFVLKAGATVVSFLASAAECVFGRYDTVLVLRAEAAEAEAMSRAVGRKVSPEDIVHLPATCSWLIHLTRVYQVALPVELPVRLD